MKNIHALPLLDLKDLHLVLAIARRGGLGAASQELHLSQSALSHHLRSIETRLGAEVFDRVGRRVVVNARGLQLIELAERLLPEVLAVERAILNPVVSPRKLRLTSGCYTAYPWLPEALVHFAKVQPGSRVQVVVDATRRAADALLAGEVDVAVMPWLSEEPRLHARYLFDEEISVVMRPDDPLARRATIPVQMLAERRVLTHEVPPSELAWIRASLGRFLSALRHVERLPLTEAIVELTKAGEGVALMGAWAIRKELEQGILVAKPMRPRLQRPFAVVTSRAQPEDPRVEVLTSVLREWINDGVNAIPIASSRSGSDQAKRRRAAAR